MEYHRIDVHIATDDTPPYFTGSMLRGAFGHALKRVTCINPSYRCENCFDQNQCLYYDLFERENRAHRYRLDVTLGSQRFDFALYLFGGLCEKLPYVLSALQMALAKNGIGRERVTYPDITMAVNGQTVYQEHQFGSIAAIRPETISVGNYTPNLKIHLLTPVRMKRKNQLAYTDLKVEHLLRSVYKRKKEIFDGVQAERLPYEPTYDAFVSTLEYKPLYRKSTRQGTKPITIGGAMGQMAVLGLDRQSYELLKVGEIIGVGKQPVFGLGKISIEEV